MDATKRPLLIDPSFSTYAEKHGIFDLYKRMLEKLVIVKPDDPLTFMVEYFKKDVDNVFKLIVLGPPVSGKSCMAKAAATALSVPHLTPEGLIKDASPDLKKEISQEQKDSQEVSTKLWTKIIEERVQRFDCSRKGWILDGYPQTKEQAQGLQAVGIYPNHVVILDAGDTLLLERAEGKRIDPDTGDIFHTVFDWPTDQAVQERLIPDSSYSSKALVDRLVLYHRNIDGLKEAFHCCHKLLNADQPKRDVYAQVLSYLRTEPRSVASFTPRVVLFGPTGSGKAVQAALLASKYSIINVQVPQLIQQAVVSETKSGLAIRKYMEKDVKVPDHLMMDVLKDRLCQLDCQTQGWVIHGFPKTVDQGERLEKTGFMPNRIFFLDLPNDSALERISLRATDPVTGERYHMLYNPPRTMDIKERLIQNPKDSESEVRSRLATYYAFYDDVQDYYKDRATHVNADRDPHTVFECIESAIVNPLPTVLDK